MYIPSTLCLLINFAKISFIFSSNPEIDFGIFFGLSSFEALIRVFLATFLAFVLITLFDFETFDVLVTDFFLTNFFFN